MRKSSVSKQSKHSSRSSGVNGRGSASRRANFLCQRATSGAPSAIRCGGCAGFGGDLGIGNDAGHQALFLRFDRIEDPAFEQQLERHRCPNEIDQRRHLRIRHHESQVLDRNAEPARHAADTEVTQRGDLEAAAHTDAVNLRDERMATCGKRMRSLVHRGAIDDRLCLVRALGREFGDVVAWRERFLAGATDDDAAQARHRRTGRSPRHRDRATSPWSAH